MYKPEYVLVVNPVQFSQNEISDFEIGLKITNHSDRILPVNLSGLALFVNSVRSVAWDLTMQNGTLMNLRLNPGQSETVVWKMGEALFESAGDYNLLLSTGEKTISKRTIVVTNNS